MVFRCQQNVKKCFGEISKLPNHSIKIKNPLVNLTLGSEKKDCANPVKSNLISYLNTNSVLSVK